MSSRDILVSVWPCREFNTRRQICRRGGEDEKNGTATDSPYVSEIIMGQYPEIRHDSVRLEDVQYGEPSLSVILFRPIFHVSKSSSPQKRWPFSN
jgi:hypothetical protein